MTFLSNSFPGYQCLAWNVKLDIPVLSRLKLEVISGKAEQLERIRERDFNILFLRTLTFRKTFFIQKNKIIKTVFSSGPD